MFTERFQRIWWLALLIATTLVVLQGLRPNWAGDQRECFLQQYAIFLVWIVLLLVPLFSEISVFGIGVKRELRALRAEVRRHAASNRLYWLGNDLASLRFQAQVIRPIEENRRMVTWQGNQALAHARATNLPDSFVERLQNLVQVYLAAPDEQQAGRFAEGILQLQMEIAAHFMHQEAHEESPC